MSQFTQQAVESDIEVRLAGCRKASDNVFCDFLACRMNHQADSDLFVRTSNLFFLAGAVSSGVTRPDIHRAPEF